MRGDKEVIVMNKYFRSFLRGATSLYFPEPPLADAMWRKHRTDGEALRSDWERVGQNLREAMDAYEKEQGAQARKIAHANVLPNRLGTGATVRHETMISSGPLPSPEAFEKYDQVLPGAAERIFTMAESESNHRIQMEKTDLGARIRLHGVGLYISAVIALTAIGAGAYVAVEGQAWAGFGLGLFGIAAVVSRFLPQRSRTQ